MTSNNVPQHLVDLLREIGMASNRHTAALARALEISHSDVAALNVLGKGLTPGQLGERLSLSSGAVTALADRLERAGLITRSPHPEDRRSVVLRPTPAARRRVAEQVAGFVDEARDAAERLSAGDRAVVASYLGLVAEAMDVNAKRIAASMGRAAVAASQDR